MSTIGKIDWTRWIPVLLALMIQMGGIVWFAAITSKDIEANQTKIADIKNSDIPSIKRDFQALSADVRTNEGSRIFMNERLIRIEERLESTKQAIDEIKRLLQKDARLRDATPNL